MLTEKMLAEKIVVAPPWLGAEACDLKVYGCSRVYTTAQLESAGGLAQ